MTTTDPRDMARRELEAATDAEAIVKALEEIHVSEGTTGPADYSVVKILGAIRKVRGLSR